jgi:four helix bundle protein
MGAHAEAKLDEKFINFARQLNSYLNHFPSFEKYGISLRIRNTAYSVYDLICESQQRYHKKTSLGNLNRAHNQLRMQLRLAFELGYFAYKKGSLHTQHEKSPEERYQVLSRMVDELGRLIGGWMRDENAEATAPVVGNPREAS